MMEIQCEAAETGVTALELLKRRIPQAPPSYLRQLLRRGKVRRQGLPVDEDCCLATGDRLQLPESRRLGEFIAQSSAPALRILFEDREILAVFKPAGLPVHRATGHTDNLADQVQALMHQRGEPFRTAPAHRLDADTSGPVLFGKGRRGIAALGEAFRNQRVEKVYIALAAGAFAAASGTLTGSVPAKGKWKEAATEFQLMEKRGNFSLLELRLLSGRTHQIRRQLADAGHPLAGDRRYGGGPVPGLNRLFLHCRRLALPHPGNGSPLEIECPMPEELARILAELPPPGDNP